MKKLTWLISAILLGQSAHAATSCPSNDKVKVFRPKPNFCIHCTYPPIYPAGAKRADAGYATNLKEKTNFVFPILALSGGVNVSSVGRSKSHYEAPPIDRPYFFNPNSSPSVQPLFGGFIGAEYRGFSSLIWQFGLSYNYLFPVTAKGVTGQGRSPIDTYSYSYKVSSNQLLLENKLLLNKDGNFHPYVSAGLGIAFNSAYAYQQTVISAVDSAVTTFADHNSSSFSYSVGLGFDIDLTKHWRLGAGYRFTDLGAANVGNGTVIRPSPFPPKPLILTLTQSHLYSHQITGQITYVY